MDEQHEIPIILAGLEGEGFDVSHVTGGKIRRHARMIDRTPHADYVARGRRVVDPDLILFEIPGIYRVKAAGRGQWFPRLLHRGDTAAHR